MSNCHYCDDPLEDHDGGPSTSWHGMTVHESCAAYLNHLDDVDRRAEEWAAEQMRERYGSRWRSISPHPA